MVVNKPGWFVCHPSKRGPWSSLVGQTRELLGLETIFLVGRLDRETSGVVLMAKNQLREEYGKRLRAKAGEEDLSWRLLEGELMRRCKCWICWKRSG